LRSEWAHIVGEEIDRLRVIADSFATSPSGYSNALQLARLILTGAAMDSQSGWGGQSFTLSLAGIWERALRKMCSELSPITGWRLAPSSKRVRLWVDASSENDPNRSMIADLLLQRGSQRWVLDAKYKRDFGSESRNDRFQMCAYTIGFRAHRATLVYPDQGLQPNSNRQLLCEKIGGAQIQIDSIALPMDKGPDECIRELSPFLFES
jgi:5-methylcytosine-specific restriction endonuclease McrBC regulatory subunit McrC